MTDHRALLEEYRDLREALERAILPLATSVDGRRFECQVSLHELELEAGGYVAIDADGEIHLGQVLALRMEQQQAGAPDRPGTVSIRLARGEGALLEGGGRPFHDGRVRPATSEEVSAWLERSQPSALDSRSASWRSRMACRSPSTLPASGDTPSSAVSPDRARPTRSASSWSSC